MTQDNLALYNQVRQVPDQAQKKIGAGRLSGMTDINPMWRIKSLTEMFGTCGFGWKYEIIRQWTEVGADGAVAAFTNINLFVKVDGSWSEAIPGTGGSALVAKESKGLYTNDEAYKMALTDAISIACKALGFGADIYFAKDRTKYDMDQNNHAQNEALQRQKIDLKKAIAEVESVQSLDDVGAVWAKYPQCQCMDEFNKAAKAKDQQIQVAFVCRELEAAADMQQLQMIWLKNKAFQVVADVVRSKDKRKEELSNGAA